MYYFYCKFVHVYVQRLMQIGNNISLHFTIGYPRGQVRGFGKFKPTFTNILPNDTSSKLFMIIDKYNDQIWPGVILSNVRTD